MLRNQDIGCWWPHTLFSRAHLFPLPDDQGQVKLPVRQVDLSKFFFFIPYKQIEKLQSSRSQASENFEERGALFSMKTISPCTEISIVPIRLSYLYDGKLYTRKDGLCMEMRPIFIHCAGNRDIAVINLSGKPKTPNARLTAKFNMISFISSVVYGFKCIFSGQATDPRTFCMTFLWLNLWGWVTRV